MNNVKILYYDRIDVSEAIDFGHYCHYWYFLKKGFKFQPYVCIRYQDSLMMPMNLSDNAILNIKGSVYCCVISKIS